jgi:hypothetical protein
MATLIANDCGVLDTAGVVQSRVVVMIGEARETGTERKPLRMRWVRDTDLEGQSIMRIHWVDVVDCAE